jgi:hypothetical protein
MRHVCHIPFLFPPTVLADIPIHFFDSFIFKRFQMFCFLPPCLHNCSNFLVESITTPFFKTRRYTSPIFTICFLVNKASACLLTRKPIDPLVFVSSFGDVTIATTSFVAFLFFLLLSRNTIGPVFPSLFEYLFVVFRYFCSLFFYCHDFSKYFFLLSCFLAPRIARGSPMWLVLFYCFELLLFKLW